jgi:hypothetical protein
MSEHPTEEQWMQTIKVDNLLQKKSPATATRQAHLIRKKTGHPESGNLGINRTK